MSRIAAAHVVTIIVPKKVTIIVPKKVTIIVPKQEMSV